uniref:Protein PML n=1 Tax=Phasianus colchicus TaxID=9054 RepID=A0A669P6W9_PHACC
MERSSPSHENGFRATVDIGPARRRSLQHRETETGRRERRGEAPGPYHAMDGLEPAVPPLEDNFQFVLCEGCQQESPDLKLLTCLHTLCLGCLRENKPVGQCPVCQTPIPQPDGIPDVDNVLFSSLQARLSIYRRVVSGAELLCDNCGSSSEYWCPECKEFLCTKCFETHQRYVKRENHEAKRVQDIRVGSPQEFLEGTRRTSSLSCPIPTHQKQTLSIYCKQCCRAVCCICALLDAAHSGQHCDVSTEARLRWDELAELGQELARRRAGFEASRAALQDEAARLEAEGLGVQELVRQRVEQLVRLIRQEEEQLLATVEERQKRGRKELESELRRVEAVLRRMEAGERLVEKMGLYATEQEVMDMQPFVKDALEELRRQRPAADGELVLHEDFAECHARLQALAERIEGPQAPLPTAGPAVPRQDTPSEDSSTPTLDLQTQLHSPGGDAPPTPPIPAAQRDEGAEEGSASPLSAAGDTTSHPKSLQASLAALQEDFDCWSRACLQHTDELLGVTTCLLQAQHRQNKHLVSLSRGVHSMARSLSAIASSMGTMLQPRPQDPRSVPTPQEPSLPSNLLDLFCSSTSHRNETDRGPAASPPAAKTPARPPSPKAPSPVLEEEHPSRGKRDWKHTAGLRKRRKK